MSRYIVRAEKIVDHSSPGEAASAFSLEGVRVYVKPETGGLWTEHDVAELRESWNFFDSASYDSGFEAASDEAMQERTELLDSIREALRGVTPYASIEKILKDEGADE